MQLTRSSERGESNEILSVRKRNERERIGKAETCPEKRPCRLGTSMKAQKKVPGAIGAGIGPLPDRNDIVASTYLVRRREGCCVSSVMRKTGERYDSVRCDARWNGRGVGIDMAKSGFSGQHLKCWAINSAASSNKPNRVWRD